MRSASALQPSAGAWRSVVSSPVQPPCDGDRGERVDHGSALGVRAADHHPPGREELARGLRDAELAQVVRARERRARAQRPGAQRGGVGRDRDERRLERAELAERHRQAVAQLAAGVPAHGTRARRRCASRGRSATSSYGTSRCSGVNHEPPTSTASARAGEAAASTCARRAGPAPPARAPSAPRRRGRARRAARRSRRRRRSRRAAGHAGSGARSSQAVAPQVIVSHTQSAPAAAPWKWRSPAGVTR